MPDQISVQVRFSVTDETGIVFQDALYIPLNEYFLLSPEQIDGLKRERFNNWKSLVQVQSQLGEDPEQDGE